jgi:hypothetical protein
VPGDVEAGGGTHRADAKGSSPVPASFDTGGSIVSQTGEGYLVNHRRGSSSLNILYKRKQVAACRMDIFFRSPSHEIAAPCR